MKWNAWSFLAAALLLGALPGAAQQRDETAWTADIDLRITMGDGTAIQLDVYRPARPGRYPALYLAGPFPHHDTLPPATPLSGPVQFYVEQGYAVVLASTRGTGGSGGNYGFLSRDEQQDHYEIIEWIAAQPWSDRKVAGAGAGYYSTSQWLAALQHPPHLECIAPYNGAPDPYRDLAFPGGVADQSFAAWYEREVRRANAFAPTTPRLVDYDLRLQQLAHPLRDDYWRLRGALGSASPLSVPVFMMATWQGEAGLASSLRLREELDSQNKLLLLDDDGSLYASPEFHVREVLPFYEWCLKGEGDAFVIQPGIRYQPVGHEQIRRDATWPPGNVDFTALRLVPPPVGDTNAAAALDFRGPEDTTAVPSVSELPREGLRFSTPVLQRDLEIAGPLMLELHFSSTGTDAAFEARLFEEAVERRLEAEAAALPSFLDPDPAPGALLSAQVLDEVTAGRLKASLRALDEERSAQYQPFHAFQTSEPLEPGRVYRLEIPLRPIAWRFRRGNRLVVEIRPVDDGSLLHTAGADNLHHTDALPSRLWIPLVAREGLPALFAAPEDAGSVVPDGSLPAPRGGAGFPAPENLFDSEDPVILRR